jgi:hypothetical protein
MVMSYPYYDLVLRAHDELVTSGQIAKRTNQEAVEQDKGLLTRRAGYYSNQEDPSIGILKKTTGNNSLGYSVDLLIRKNGTFWDVATDDGGMAMPVDGGPSGPDPQLAKDGWTQPTAELAGLGESGGEGGGADLTAQAPPYDEDYSVQFGTACNQAYEESGATPDGGMIAVHAMRCAYDYYVAGMAWDACYTKHVNEFRAEYGLPPI